MNAREFVSLALSLLLLTGGTGAPVYGQEAAAGTMTIEDLRMTVSRSLVIDYPADVSRISTSNPDVVDAVPATTREFLLHGKGIGAATVVVWAKNGQRTMYNITVEHNLEPIRKLLKDTFPNEQVGVQAGRDSISLTGQVASREVAERMQAMATPLAKNVVNSLTIAPSGVAKQIVLKVRFAQMDRNITDQFAVNIASTGFLNTPGSLTTQQFSSYSLERLSGRIPGGNTGTTTTFNIADSLNLFAFRPDLNLTAFMKNLQQKGLLQILAEPNLVTSNGKEASFLAGGEFPVPILQGGSNAGAVTVQFKEFGIRLFFTPQLTDYNTIKLHVKPEVSSIDIANAVTLAGFTIPALATKKFETNIELAEGQSFVIAGLLDERVQEAFSRLPGLSNIPVLGALFKSKNETRARSELIVLVTPEITEALNPGDPKPSPTWVKPFMPGLRPGEEAGLGIINPTTVPTVPQAENKEPRPGQKPVANANDPKEDGGPLGRLKFWGKKEDKPAVQPAVVQPAVVQPAVAQVPAPAVTTPAATTPAATTPAEPAPVTAAPVLNPDPDRSSTAAAPAASGSRPPDEATTAGTQAAPGPPVSANSGKESAPKADPRPRASIASRRPAAAEITSLPEIAGKNGQKSNDNQ